MQRRHQSTNSLQLIYTASLYHQWFQKLRASRIQKYSHEMTSGVINQEIVLITTLLRAALLCGINTFHRCQSVQVFRVLKKTKQTNQKKERQQQKKTKFFKTYVRGVHEWLSANFPIGTSRLCCSHLGMGISIDDDSHISSSPHRPSYHSPSFTEKKNKMTKVQ